MKKILQMINVIICLMTILCTVVVHVNAQSPQAFKYQTLIRDNAGDIMINQNVSFRISIIQGELPGTAVYTETHVATTNDFGLAILEIGRGTPESGNFTAIEWGSTTYFLKTELDPEGGVSFVEMGTSELLSVPYALYAEQSGTPSGWSLTGNNGTNPALNFIGTTDNQPLIFRVNNLPAGEINSSNNNTAFGAAAGLLLTSGSNNILLGYKAGKNLTNGSNNIILGYDADAPLPDGNNQLVIGASDLLYGDLANKRIGIGTTTPTFRFEVSGSDALLNGVRVGRGQGNSIYSTAVGYQALNSNTIGSHNTAIGSSALYSNTSGASNTAIGKQALYNNTKGIGNTALGNFALYENSGNSYSTAIGSLAMANYDNDPAGKFAFNTAVGSEALSGVGPEYSNGRYNTAIGASTLFYNESGSYNTATGCFTLNNNSTGHDNSAIGYEALYSNTTGSYNAALGAGALYSSTNAYCNTATGCLALYSNLTGYSNTANGYKALYMNTSGYENTATGFLALNNNVANQRSTAMGYQAMQYADNRLAGRETFNTAIGYMALKGSSSPENNTGQYNTAIGDQALYSDISGYENTALGSATLYSNTTGYQNLAVGKSALYSNTAGNMNTASGYQALFNNTDGELNTANGYKALLLNSSGVENTAIGAYSLYYNKANSRSTAIGFHAMLYADSRTQSRETFNTAIGYEALKGSNSHENNTGQLNTAIGDQAMLMNTTGERNTATGANALNANTTGDRNTAIGTYALETNTTGYYNTALGNSADVNAEDASNATAVGYNATAATNSVAIGSGASTSLNTNSVALGYDADATTSNQVRLGNGSITSLYCVGAYQNITSTPASLYVNSVGRIGKLSASEKIATNKKPIGIITSKIYDLTPLSYTIMDGDDQYIGFIADDVASILPELVTFSKESSVVEGSNSENLIPDAVNYDKLSVLMLEEMKKLKKQNEDLQRQIDELKTNLKR